MLKYFLKRNCKYNFNIFKKETFINITNFYHYHFI